MSDTEFVITEGRAYHRGDVVILRGPFRAREQFERIRTSLDKFEAKTGVVVLLIDESVEVVEPADA